MHRTPSPLPPLPLLHSHAVAPARSALRRRTALAAMATLALGATGCARYYYGAAATPDPQSLVEHNQAAADALLAQVPLAPGQRVLVRPLTGSGRQVQTARLGGVIAGQVAGRLVQRGLRVVEAAPGAAGGDGATLPGLALSGTYAVSAQAVYVSLKLVGSADHAVLAAHDYALPLDGNVRSLLG